MKQILLTGMLLLLATCCGCANARYDTGTNLDLYSNAVQVYAIPAIAQTDKYQCGYACVASVALYYQIPSVKLTSGAIAEKHIGRALSAEDLIGMAKGLGLVGFAYEGDVADLLKNLRKGRPLIVLLSHPPRVAHYPSFAWAEETAETPLAIPHWVVVTGVSPNGDIILNDPRRGRLRMSSETFMKEWNEKARVTVLFGTKTSS